MTVDRNVMPHYIDIMNPQTSNSKDNIDIQKLEASVDELIQICESLQGENARLRDRQGPVLAEHSKLAEKKAFAYSRVESLIRKLKTLEVEL